MSEMKDRMLRGDLYIADDPELAAENARAMALLDRFNATTHAEHEDRPRLLRELLGSVGEDVVITPPFRCGHRGQLDPIPDRRAARRHPAARPARCTRI